MKSRATRSLAGKPIMDAKAPMKVKVTRRDINKAKKASPMSCALAKGLTRDEHIVSVRVGVKVALVEFKDRVVRFELKPQDTEKIRAFDYARYFEPGIVELMPPKKKLGIHTINHRKKPSGPNSGIHVTRRKPMRHVWRV